MRDNDTVVGTCDRAIKKLEILEISQNVSNQPNLNPNLGGLFRGSFLGVGGGGVKLPPPPHAVENLLELR